VPPLWVEDSLLLVVLEMDAVSGPVERLLATIFDDAAPEPAAKEWAPMNS
jgi:hypothetical protein